MKLVDIPYNGYLVPVSLVHGDQYYADDGRVFIKNGDGWRVLFDNKFIIANGRAIKISMCPDGLWRDKAGTIVACREDGSWVDPDPRCGRGFFSLPLSSRLTDACRIHDYQYDSPAYQVFHTESEANEELARNLKKVGASNFVAKLFYGIVTQLGMWWWENKKTKNK